MYCTVVASLKHLYKLQMSTYMANICYWIIILLSYMDLFCVQSTKHKYLHSQCNDRVSHTIMVQMPSKQKNLIQSFDFFFFFFLSFLILLSSCFADSFFFFLSFFSFLLDSSLLVLLLDSISANFAFFFASNFSNFFASNFAFFFSSSLAFIYLYPQQQGVLFLFINQDIINLTHV